MPSRKGRKGRKKGRKKKRVNQRPATSQSQQQQQQPYTATAGSAGSVPPPHKNLRFAPGDIILARCGYWRRGKIVECNVVQYDADGPPERYAYSFVCDSNCSWSAPEDKDWYIRPFSKEILLTLDGPPPESLLLEQEFPAGMVVIQAGWDWEPVGLACVLECPIMRQNFGAAVLG